MRKRRLKMKPDRVVVFPNQQALEDATIDGRSEVGLRLSELMTNLRSPFFLGVLDSHGNQLGVFEVNWCAKNPQDWTMGRPISESRACTNAGMAGGFFFVLADSGGKTETLKLAVADQRIN
jgi:hypothetical protein